MTVASFPDRVGPSRERRKIAQFLREIADAIEADEIETAPHAVLMVLTGPDQHEVVACGYAKDAAGIRGAASAAHNMLRFGWLRQGRNIAKREHRESYGEAYRPQNIVMFAKPAARRALSQAPSEEDGSRG